jgi:ADP-heptose:LPS heptosyltransferase
MENEMRKSWPNGDHAYRLAAPLPHHIAIVRALPGLGDLLCVTPALRALRLALPQAHVTLIGLPQARAYAERFHTYLDDFLEFPGYPGIAERPPNIRRLPAFFAAVQGRFDLALQIHGSGGASNPFTVLLGAPVTAGFFLPGQYCPDESRFLPYPAHEPEVWRYLRLMEFLGLPLQGEALEFPLTETDWQALRTIPESQELAPGEYICIHPGATYPGRRWSARQFAVVADALASQGFRVVLTGSAAEKELVLAVSLAMERTALDLSGRTTLGALAALLSQARLLICNDTGVSHLAAALRIPSVVIFLNSDAARWAPLNHELHRVVGGYASAPAGNDLATAGPCVNRRCLRDGCMCLPMYTLTQEPATVSEAAVLAQVEDLLQRKAVHVA